MLKSYKIVLHPFRHQLTQDTKASTKESPSNKSVRGVGGGDPSPAFWCWELERTEGLSPGRPVIGTACQSYWLSTGHTAELYRASQGSAEHAELSADRAHSRCSAGGDKGVQFTELHCFMRSPCRLESGHQSWGEEAAAWSVPPLHCSTGHPSPQSCFLHCTCLWVTGVVQRVTVSPGLPTKTIAYTSFYLQRSDPLG